MRRCDGCSTDPCACDSDEEAGDIVDLRPLAQAPVAVRSPLPVEVAVAPLRAQHHHAIVAAATWCLEQGLSCNRDSVALCLSALEWDRNDDQYELDRPTVMSALRRAMTEACNLGTAAPEDLPEAMWAVISWLHHAESLVQPVPPLEVLLEPMRCYGGLDDKGVPRPPGTDIDFGCQCYVPYDPKLPAGVGKHFVGWNPSTCLPMLPLGPLHPRGQPSTAEDREPLLLYAIQSGTPITGLVYAGRVSATKAGPELWIFRPVSGDRSAVQMFLTAGGDRWRPVADGRYRSGVRWAPVRTYRITRRRPWDDPVDWDDPLEWDDTVDREDSTDWSQPVV